MSDNKCASEAPAQGLAGIRGRGGYLQKTIDAKGPTYQERLEYQLVDVNKRKAEIEEALEILKRNPDIERLLTLVGGI